MRAIIIELDKSETEIKDPVVVALELNAVDVDILAVIGERSTARAKMLVSELRKDGERLTKQCRELISLWPDKEVIFLKERHALFVELASIFREQISPSRAARPVTCLEGADSVLLK